MPAAIQYEEGQKVGNLYFVRNISCKDVLKRRYDRQAIFLCVCGKEFSTCVRSVKNEEIKFCSVKCQFRKDHVRENRTTHGHSIGGNTTDEYNTWLGMKRRCSDTKHKCYKYYVGKGIKVCDDWINSFENFFKDMGKRPSEKHSIERRNGNLNYDYNNCYWATRREQAVNKSCNHYLTYSGKTLCITEWAELLKISRDALSTRIRRGWAVEKALTHPVGKYKFNN